jgi:hypothetical protein
MAFSLFADDNNSNSNSTLNSKEGIVLNQEFQIELYQKVSSLKEGLTLELDLMNEDPPPGSPHSYYPPYILRVISHKNCENNCQKNLIIPHKMISNPAKEQSFSLNGKNYKIVQTSDIKSTQEKIEDKLGFILYKNFLENNTFISSNKVFDKQIQKKSSWKLVSTSYNSKLDPMLKETDQEADAEKYEKKYTSKKGIELIDKEERIYVLAPPNDKYIWRSEKFYANQKLYLLNFRHALESKNEIGSINITLTEYKVYIQNQKVLLVLKRKYDCKKENEFKEFSNFKDFIEMDLDSELNQDTVYKALLNEILNSQKFK